MVNQNSAETQKAKSGDDANEVMDPHDPIETATTGTGTTSDPVGPDTKPPSNYYGEGDPIV